MSTISHHEAAHAFGVEWLLGDGHDRDARADFHEWCEHEKIPPADRNAIWDYAKHYTGDYSDPT